MRAHTDDQVYMHTKDEAYANVQHKISDIKVRTHFINEYFVVNITLGLLETSLEFILFSIVHCLVEKHNIHPVQNNLSFCILCI